MAGPTEADRRLAERLGQMWAELDRVIVAGLRDDSLHADVLNDLEAAQDALRNAQNKLLLAE